MLGFSKCLLHNSSRESAVLDAGEGEYSSYITQVLQENRTNGTVYVCVKRDREKKNFKELAHIVVGLGKLRICRTS